MCHMDSLKTCSILYYRPNSKYLRQISEPFKLVFFFFSYLQQSFSIITSQIESITS